MRRARVAILGDLRNGGAEWIVDAISRDAFGVRDENPA